MTDNTKYRSKTFEEINSIDIDRIKLESISMCDELLQSKYFSRDELIIKYDYLYKKANSIFNKIISDINDQINNTPRVCKDGIKRAFIFNKFEFKTNLEVILNQIQSIKDCNVKNSDPNTHKIISDNFNNKYIPSKFLDK